MSQKEIYKIALFLPGFGNGGAERVFIRLLHYLKSRGHKVDLIVASKKGDLVDRLDDDVIYLGSRYSLTSFSKYTRYIRDESPDIVMATLFGAIVVSGITKMFGFTGNTQLICRIANITHKPRGIFQLTKYLLERIALNQADGVITNSNATLDSIEDLLEKEQNRNIVTISNPVLDDDYQKRIRDCSDIKRVRDIVIIGRFVPQKQISHAIKAFSIIKKTVTDARLIIVGDGPESEEIMNMINERNLGSEVKIIKYHDDIPSLLMSSKCMINTSLFEGFGNIFIEGLAFCENIVCYKSIGGASELLHNTNAILIKQGDIDSLASEVSKLLLADSERSVKDIDKGFLDQFTVSHIGRRYEDFILNTLERSS